MKEIRLCDDTKVNRVLDLCNNNNGKVLGRPSYMNDEHLGINMGTMDIKNILKLLEEYCPNAIWNIESKLDYIEESVEVLKNLGYIKK